MKKNLNVEIKENGTSYTPPTNLYKFNLKNENESSKTEVDSNSDFTTFTITKGIAQTRPNALIADNISSCTSQQHSNFDKIYQLQIAQGINKWNTPGIICATIHTNNWHPSNWDHRTLTRKEHHRIGELKHMAQLGCISGITDKKRKLEILTAFFESTGFKPITDEQSAIDSLGLKEIKTLEDSCVFADVTDAFDGNNSITSVYKTLQDLENGQKPLLVQLYHRTGSDGINEYYRQMKDGTYCNISSFKLENDKGTFEKCSYEDLIRKANSLGLTSPVIQKDEKVVDMLKNGVSLTLTPEEIKAFTDEVTNRRLNGTIQNEDSLCLANFADELQEILQVEKKELDTDAR